MLKATYCLGFKPPSPRMYNEHWICWCLYEGGLHMELAHSPGEGCGGKSRAMPVIPSPGHRNISQKGLSSFPKKHAKGCVSVGIVTTGIQVIKYSVSALFEAHFISYLHLCDFISRIYPWWKHKSCWEVMCGNGRFPHACFDVFHRSGGKYKKPCLCGSRTFLNVVHHQNLESTQPVASCFPRPNDDPHWEMWDFCAGMGSCYISRSQQCRLVNLLMWLSWSAT